MKVYQVEEYIYYRLITKYAGLLFHRKEGGKYFIKPLRSIEYIVSKLAIIGIEPFYENPSLKP